MIGHSMRTILLKPDECDAFDSDVDEGPTTQTMFMANLTSEDPIYDEAGPSYDSNTLFEIYPNDQYVEDNEEHIVQSNVSSVRDDALMSILDEMHEQGVQSRLANKPNMVVKDSVTSELARYKELVGEYEKWANKGLPPRLLERRTFLQLSPQRNPDPRTDILVPRSQFTRKTADDLSFQTISALTVVSTPILQPSLSPEFLPTKSQVKQRAIIMYSQQLFTIDKTSKRENPPTVFTKGKEVLAIRKDVTITEVIPFFHEQPPLFKADVLNKGKQIWKPKGKLSDNSLNKTKRVWKATGKLFADIGYQWRPTGKKFTLGKLNCGYQWRPTGKKFALGEMCPLKLTFCEMFYSTLLNHRTPRCSKHMTGNRSKLKNFVEKFIGTVRFGNDHFGAIMGYRDYVIGDSVISRVYYVEGLGHNLFSTNFKGSRSTNLYTISIDDMMKSSPICLLSKASKSKSWLWHRRLNHLNFGTINDLARKDLVRGLPRLKFEKDHSLAQPVTLGKSMKFLPH
ncbi:retrovirus-related pol polyprotein from transposon TNT 1-94 [Tanacetum coccineum]